MLTRRDRAVIGGLLLVLVLLAAAVAWPSIRPGGPACRRPRPPGRRPALPRGDRRPADLGEPVRGAHRGGPGAWSTSCSRASSASARARRWCPDLAERWTVDPTGAVYTFTLRDDARWHDGTPVTAADVAFTIAVLQDPAYTGPGAASWRDVTVTAARRSDGPDGAGEPDRRLPGRGDPADRPGPSARGDPGRPAGGQPVRSAADRQRPVSARVVERRGGEPRGVRPGRGGGREATWLPRAAIRSRARRRRRPPAVRCRTSSALEFRFFTDPAELVAAYQAGDLDAATGLPPADAAAPRRRPRARG